MIIPLSTILEDPQLVNLVILNLCVLLILIKLFRHIPAIPACPATTYHSLKALDIASVVNSISGPAAMHKLSQSYSSLMPSWIRVCIACHHISTVNVTPSGPCVKCMMSTWWIL